MNVADENIKAGEYNYLGDNWEKTVPVTVVHEHGELMVKFNSGFNSIRIKNLPINSELLPV
jgi:hypothetical protein